MTAMCPPTYKDGRVVQGLDPVLTELQRKLFAIFPKVFMSAANA
jgi:hypothetical protein